MPRRLRAWGGGRYAVRMQPKDDTSARLAVYGSLAPGEEHANVLAPLAGYWRQARVAGTVDRSGRYPRFAPGCGVCPVWIFESSDLPSYWPTLDEFEGEGYRRMTIQAETGEGGAISVQIYVAA
jgi:gamma-glutamylcyclotransferase (GGCT)/AIG2-like uncharacterized protein YtfP